MVCGGSDVSKGRSYSLVSKKPKNRFPNISTCWSPCFVSKLFITTGSGEHSERKLTRKTVLVLLVISFMVVRCTQSTKLHYWATIPPWVSSVDLEKLGSSLGLFFYEWICSIALKLFCLKYSVQKISSAQNLIFPIKTYWKLFVTTVAYVTQFIIFTVLWRIYSLKNRRLSAVSPSPSLLLPYTLNLVLRIVGKKYKYQNTV